MLNMGKDTINLLSVTNAREPHHTFFYLYHTRAKDSSLLLPFIGLFSVVKHLGWSSSKLCPMTLLFIQDDQKVSDWLKFRNL
jgi:hypothetical protein